MFIVPFRIHEDLSLTIWVSAHSMAAQGAAMAAVLGSGLSGFETKCNCHEFLSELVSSEQKVVSGGMDLMDRI